LLHTPLKRARLPITPPEQIFKSEISNLKFSNNYLFAGASEFTGTPSDEFEFVLEAEIFEFPSVEAAVFEFVSAVVASVEAGASVGASGLLLKTETFPVNAGIARSKAESMNIVAAAIVTFDKTVAVPRGARAELETLLVNNAPASVLPGCSKTAATSTKQERKNNPYKK
jgi:hypothetical protein